MAFYFGTEEYMPPVKCGKYTVYKPKYSKPTYNFGFYTPFLLVLGDEIRVSTFEEEEAFWGVDDSDDDSDEMKPSDKITGLGENE